MDFLELRRMKYYMRLTYPVRVVAVGDTFHGDYPDLPGCRRIHECPERLYGELEAARHQWILARVLAGDPIPLPNSHLGTAEELSVRSREATAS